MIRLAIEVADETVPPLAVVVVFPAGLAVVLRDGGVDRVAVSDSLVRAAFELVDVLPPAGKPTTGVFDVEKDGL